MPRDTRPRTEFTVTGIGPFPMDMLRYDQAWPKTKEDGDTILTTYRPENCLAEFQITLLTDGAFGAGPTTARWESHGWLVDISL